MRNLKSRLPLLTLGINCARIHPWTRGGAQVRRPQSCSSRPQTASHHVEFSATTNKQPCSVSSSPSCSAPPPPSSARPSCVRPRRIRRSLHSRPRPWFFAPLPRAPSRAGLRCIPTASLELRRVRFTVNCTFALRKPRLGIRKRGWSFWGRPCRGSPAPRDSHTYLRDSLLHQDRERNNLQDRDPQRRRARRSSSTTP